MEFFRECFKQRLSMYPQYYGNGVTQNDQADDNSARRGEQVNRQDGSRMQSLQNPYSVVNMNMGMPGQQYDPRFIGVLNPALNSNSGMPYQMVSNLYGEGIRTMPLQYDRRLYAYGVPIPLMDMNPGGYYSYIGMRQGVPVASGERPPVFPTTAESLQQQSERPVQPLDSTTSTPAASVSKPKGTPTLVKKDNVTQSTPSTSVTNSEDAASKLAQSQSSAPVKTEPSSVPSTTGKETDTSMELLANMLLQISKGKDANTSNVTSLAQGSNSQVPFVKMENKRQRLNDASYEMSTQAHQNYPVIFSQYPSFMPSKSTYPFSVTPSRYNYAQPSTSTPPPIPPPAPVHKTTRPVPSVGDYYVFCTVCRHGTPINVTRPIPEMFKCSNCGFSCALDTHLLSYYGIHQSFAQAASSASTVNVKEESGVVNESSPVIDPLHTLQTVQVAQAMPTVQSVKQEPPPEADPKSSSPAEPAQADLSLINSFVLQSSPEKPMTVSLLQSLAERPSVSAETTSCAELTKEQITQLGEQCRAAPKDWWLGKYVKLEVPVSKLSASDMPVKEENKEEVKQIVVGEVVGMNESGFVVEVDKTTIAVDDFVHGTSRCWLLLKESYPNLVLCS